MKHTKGEWRRGHIHGDEFPNHTHVYSELGLNADGVMVIKTIAYLPKRGTPEETSADGFLMAAAPDLLSALQLLLSSAHDYQSGITEAQDAINKAKGLTK